MLQFKVKDLSNYRIEKLTSKYPSIKVNYQKQSITIFGNITEELLTELYNVVKITSVQNFATLNHPQFTKSYDLIYPNVMYGQVYWCDLGIPYGREQGFFKIVIVIQKVLNNFYSPTTIVISCNSKYKKSIPVHYSFSFSEENMLDYDKKRISKINNEVALGEQIKTIDKSRLRKFIGTMTPEFMFNIQKILNIK